MQTERLRLLPEERLVRTGPVDHASWNYRGVLGWVQRERFRLIRRLLGTTRRERLLEIGYGSGVFLPELSRYAAELCGVDVHELGPEVTAALAAEGVKATLVKGSASDIPFDPGYFDAIVAVSVFEFVDDMDAACREIDRVLSPRGAVFVVTPGISPVVDLGLRVLTGKSAKDDFADRRERVIPGLERAFRVVRRITFPPVPVPGVRLYTALELVKR